MSKLERAQAACNVGGKKRVIVMGSTGSHEPVEVVPSGSRGLDLAMGVLGFPRGRVVEILGPESSGKSTLALTVIASAHRMYPDEPCGYIDAEHAMDRDYTAKLGCDLDRLLLCQPDCGEDGLDVCERMVESAVPVIVVDSVAALTPKAEIDGEMGEAHVGLHARLMSQALRKLTAKVAKSNSCVIFINQIREKIGVMFGNPETTTGGRALKFYSSIRLDIRRVAGVKGKGTGVSDIGNRVRVKVIKNKLAPPFRQAEFDLIFGKGVDRGAELVDLARTHEVFEQAGAWYTWNGKRMGQGKDAVSLLLNTDLELAEKIWLEVKAKAGEGLNCGQAESK
jgi:recombination protein RecA